MEAPLHQPCGTRHWSSQPCPANKDSRAKATTGKAAISAANKAPPAGRVASRPSRAGGSAVEAAVEPTIGPAASPKLPPPREPLSPAEREAMQAEKRRGRPRIHENRKAYKAKKERERRAKLKEGK